jgi:hypothetical protein
VWEEERKRECRGKKAERWRCIGERKGEYKGERAEERREETER